MLFLIAIRRRRQRERRSNGFEKAKQRLARASRILVLVHFFPVTAQLRRQSAYLTFCGKRQHKTTTFFFFFSTSIQSFRIQLQKK